MKSRPIILISASVHAKGVEFQDTSVSLSLNYPRAIQDCGGIPWVAPCLPEPEFVAESVRRCHGVMLSGGDDVGPGLYHPDPLPSQLRKTVETVTPERDLFELMLIDEVFRQKKPLLAICRGQQILNVALGGTLVVDIPTQVKEALNHSQSDKKDQLVHEVEVEPGSLLAKAVGRMRLRVNSSHHQAVEKIAEPFRANAVSKDGIVEGLELAPEARHYLPYLMSVQFHPERLYRRHAEHRALFEQFTEACRRHGHSKI